MTLMTVTEVKQALLACIQAGIEPAVDRACLVAGSQVAWDSCQCGQLTISEVARYASVEFPTEAPPQQDSCGAPWLVIQLMVTLARCVPSSDSAGNPPSCEDLTTAALQQDSDMGAMRRAAECCLQPLYNDHTLPAYQITRQQPNGPSGGCSASEMTVYLGMLNNCGCG